jgi:hypothetical protein
MTEPGASKSVEFKPLKDLGSLPLNATSELKFYVDEYKGFKYGSIRTFVTGEGYTGPTKSGVTLNPAILAGVIEALETLPKTGASFKEEKELGRFPKKIGVALVLRITLFKDAPGLDLREWVEEEGYTGWSKKGVRVPYEELASTIQRLKQMQEIVGLPKAKP